MDCRSSGGRSLEHHLPWPIFDQIRQLILDKACCFQSESNGLVVFSRMLADQRKVSRRNRKYKQSCALIPINWLRHTQRKRRRSSRGWICWNQRNSLASVLSERILNSWASRQNGLLVHKTRVTTCKLLCWRSSMRLLAARLLKAYAQHARHQRIVCSPGQTGSSLAFGLWISDSEPVSTSKPSSRRQRGQWLPNEELHWNEVKVFF